MTFHLGLELDTHGFCFSTPTSSRVGANRHVHWFIGGKGLGIQQGRSEWVGSPKSLFKLGPKTNNTKGENIVI